MSNISAFVGHSFLQDDDHVVREFLGFFDHLKPLVPGFTWDHAEAAEPKILSQKVREKMAGKNLFIGICTSREQVVVPTSLQTSWLRKDVFKVNQSDLQWKTADWILQEIGFAFAKNMNIMLLLEEGMREPGGLQGDLEYIPFNRKSPEQSHTKILEMLTSMTPRIAAVAGELVSSAEPTHQEADEQKEDKPALATQEPTDSWGWEEYHSALLWAIVDNDSNREEKMFQGYLATLAGEDENERINWRAHWLLMRHNFLKVNVLDELKQLQKDHPGHSMVAAGLARIYRGYENHDKAATQYAIAADCTKNADQKVSLFCNAALSAVRYGNENLALQMIEQAKEVKSTNEHDATMMEVLAEISEIRKDTDSNLAFKEGKLSIHPDDQKERASLAYKYFDTGENDLVLYHYRLVVKDKSDDAAAWNNIGAAAGHLSLDAKAVEAYRRGERLGETVAMSNLANKLIDQGFLEEADQLCEKATKIENYDHRIGSAISRIKKVREEEEEKENSLLVATSTRRLFYVEFAHACLDKLPNSLPNRWKGEDCELTVTVSEGIFEAAGSFKQPKTALGLAFLGITEEQIVAVRWSGALLGRGAKFSFWRKPERSRQTILGGAMNPPAKGLMIISEDLRQIRFYEKAADGKGKFYKWESLE